MRDSKNLREAASTFYKLGKKAVTRRSKRSTQVIYRPQTQDQTWSRSAHAGVSGNRAMQLLNSATTLVKALRFPLPSVLDQKVALQKDGELLPGRLL